jgi:hypothetical protein
MALGLLVHSFRKHTLQWQLRVLGFLEALSKPWPFFKQQRGG